MLHILTIEVREIKHAFALAISNTDVQQDSPILCSRRKNSGLSLCFIIKKCKYFFSFLKALMLSNEYIFTLYF